MTEGSKQLTMTDMKNGYVPIEDVDLKKLDDGFYWIRSTAGNDHLCETRGGYLSEVHGNWGLRYTTLISHISGPIEPPKMEGKP